MKLCLERRIGKRIPPKHPIVAWLVTHCAALIRYRVRGFDGKTPYERVRMRPFGSRLVCFAEKVMYKDRAKEKTDDEHRWHRGIFLGMCAMTGQYTLYDEEKKVVKQARTIKLVPDQQKWDVELIEEVASTPYNEHAGHEQEVAFQDRPSRPEDEDPAKKIAKSRRIYIKGEDIKAFGYTVGCPKCDHERRYGPGRTTKGHSDLCRRRIIDELMKTPEGLRRIQNADERLTRTLAEHVEAQAQGPQDHGGGEMQLEACPWCPPTPVDDLRFDDLEKDAEQPAPQNANASNGRDLHEPGRDRDEQPKTHGGDTGDFHNEVNDDMDVADEPLRELMKMWDAGLQKEAKETNGEILSFIRQLGGNAVKYQRERGKAIRAIVSEIYSPPRVSAVAKMFPSYGILPGFALDLTTHDHDGRHWDFDEEEMRERAWDKIKKEQPLLLIGSPMCTAFSSWQHINNSKRDAKVVAGEKARGMRHLILL